MPNAYPHKLTLSDPSLMNPNSEQNSVLLILLPTSHSVSLLNSPNVLVAKQGNVSFPLPTELMNSIHQKSVAPQQRKEAIDAYLQKIVSKNGIPLKEDTSQKRD